jgi:7-cyano-7-deazaguanine synthase
MKKAVVLVSGGLDSATTLALAQEQGYVCYALSFDYGQRHRCELDAARKVAEAAGVVEHKVITLNLDNIGGSALTDIAIPVPQQATEGWAEVLEAEAIFIGVNAVDYSGYPDCRPEFIEAFAHMAQLATKAGVEGRPIRIETPLIHLSKAEIIQQGMRLGVNYANTISCYDPDTEGRACGQCDSCRLRAAGFEAAGVADPTRYQPGVN